MGIAPATVLDIQAEFIARSMQPKWREAAHHLADEQFKPNGIDIVSGFGDTITTHLREASAFHVTESMVATILDRSNAMPDNRWINGFDPPTPMGIVTFDIPLKFTELRGRTQLVHTVTWGPISTNQGTAWLFSAWNDTSREPDDIFQLTVSTLTKAQLALRNAIFGHWDAVGYFAVSSTRTVGPQRLPIAPEQRKRGASEGFEVYEGGNIIRYLMAMWELMGESIHESAPIPRPFARRAARARIPAKVTVVALRRTDDSVRTPGPHDIEWTHRWNVRGHWREIRDRKTGALKYKAWIPAHIKGPQEKPLINKPKVYDLRR